MIASSTPRSKAELGHLPNWPLMLDATAAAAYVGLARSRFLRAVAHGELPAPRRLGGDTLWLRPEIDRQLDPSRAHADSADDVDPILAAIEAAEVA